MMPPTSIDGTDITGATIDGTDVTEITVDGDTVFTASDVPDSGLDHELYRFNAQFALESGINPNTSPFDWPEMTAGLSDATAISNPTLRDDQQGFAASEYDGTNDGHSFNPDGDGPTGNSSHSFAATVYINSFSGDPPIIAYGPDRNGEMSLLRVRLDQTVGFTRRDAGVNGSTTINTQQWITIGASYNGQNDEAIVYLNGNQDGSDPNYGPLNLDNINGNIGSRPDTFNDFADAFVFDAIVSDDVESSSAFSNYHSNMLS